MLEPYEADFEITLILTTEGRIRSIELPQWSENSPLTIRLLLVLTQPWKARQWADVAKVLHAPHQSVRRIASEQFRAGNVTRYADGSVRTSPQGVELLRGVRDAWREVNKGTSSSLQLESGTTCSAHVIHVHRRPDRPPTLMMDSSREPNSLEFKVLFALTSLGSLKPIDLAHALFGNASVETRFVDASGAQGAQVRRMLAGLLKVKRVKKEETGAYAITESGTARMRKLERVANG